MSATDTATIDAETITMMTDTAIMTAIAIDGIGTRMTTVVATIATTTIIGSEAGETGTGDVHATDLPTVAIPVVGGKTIGRRPAVIGRSIQMTMIVGSEVGAAAKIKAAEERKAKGAIEVEVDRQVLHMGKSEWAPPLMRNVVDASIVTWGVFTGAFGCFRLHLLRYIK